MTTCAKTKIRSFLGVDTAMASLEYKPRESAPGTRRWLGSLHHKYTVSSAQDALL